MTSQDKNLLNQKSQKGATLLLGILVLAAMSAIVFSVAALALNETRTSGDLIKTEPAITAAEAGTEDVLYYVIRGVGTYSSDCSNPTNSTLNNLTLSVCNNLFFSDPGTFQVGPNSEKALYLFDPTNPSSNSGGYTAIQVTLEKAASNGTVDICSWTNLNCDTSPDIATMSIQPGASTSLFTLSATSKYQVFLVNSNAASSDVFQILTKPKGIPSSQNIIITSGANHGVTRKIETNLGQ